MITFDRPHGWRKSRAFFGSRFSRVRLEGRTYGSSTFAGPSVTQFLPSHASDLPDARSRRGVNGGEELLARQVNPFGGGRPWLRRTRALCKFNCGKGGF